MDMLGITGVAAITVICYLVGAGLKAWDKFDDRKIPVIMGIVGAVLGAAAFFASPSLVATDNIFTAIAIGIVSGFAATGINQIYKQSKKEGNNEVDG